MMRIQGTYLTDFFQGGDKEVVTYDGQCVEHIHGLEERQGKEVKLGSGPGEVLQHHP